jgi:3'5'-cyclic nucleotide phosphodiesterase/Adenylate and Guanylate cyclase catalytic domain
MESTGIAGRIQISQKTADLLMADGKESWLTKRDGLVEAKGKGSMVTYWLLPAKTITVTSDSSGRSEGGTTRTAASTSIVIVPEALDDTSRLVEWNVGVFRELLEQVVSSRCQSVDLNDPNTDDAMIEFSPLVCPLNEISEFLEIPKADILISDDLDVSQSVLLCENVEAELRDFIIAIAYSYRSNPFHNFEHASHVVMSTMKLLDRIRSHELDSSANVIESSSSLYLDPVVQLGVVFAALVHDVDHLGMSNQQLIDENLPIAQMYNNKSIAEQNSIDLSWRIFMEPRFMELRRCMFASTDDLRRFRKVVVNSVLATDIFDKDLKAFRDVRWEQVFVNPTLPSVEDNGSRERNFYRKNAIVIEHLIQASDVVHTMQHWKIYQKWNKRLFMETYKAFEHGDSLWDPTVGWYKGELWFFDNYIIPLAKKLRTCGVFGVSCDEFLDYAVDNRYEWENKGEGIILEWKKEIQSSSDWDEENEITFASYHTTATTSTT